MPAVAQMQLEINEKLDVDSQKNETKPGANDSSDIENAKKSEIAGEKVVEDDSVKRDEAEKDGDDVQPKESEELEFSFTQIPRSSTIEALRNNDVDEKPLLRGSVSTLAGSGRIPILSGSIQSIPKKTEIELVVPQGVILDSEYSQKGDEVYLRIGKDVKTKDGKRILLPGEWYVRGLVTKAQGKRRGGRDGILEIRFDKLISPDNQYELDLDASFSSKDRKLKSVAKVVAIDSTYVGVGMGAGSLLAWQIGGAGTAISTYGISIGVGAAIGGTIGLVGALKRKGKIASFREGQVIKLTTAEGLALPEFDPEALPSAKVKPKLKGLEVTVEKFKFRKTPWKDKHSRFLDLDLSVDNQSKRTFHFFDLAVQDDLHRTYRPFLKTRSKNISPGDTGGGKITFLVGSPKRKYTLLFFSRRNNSELTSVSIN